MFISDLFINIYPIMSTYQALKFPRLKIIKHWLTYWLIWIILEVIETLTLGYIPLWGLIKPCCCIINMKPMFSEISLKFIYVTYKHTSSQLKNFDQLTNLKNNLNHLTNNNFISQYITNNPYVIWWFTEQEYPKTL